MSYGNYIIYGDLNRGLTVKQVAKKLHNRYPDISLSRATKIVRIIKRRGPDVEINLWITRNKRGVRK